jgi:hypothetical protein
MNSDNNIGKFFDWLSKPMNQDDISAWYLANNITAEFTELFRDFCFSLLILINDTYLGDDTLIGNETKVGMSTEQKKNHFKWCWEKTIKNFNMEKINFIFNLNDFEFFESFFFDSFYNQSDNNFKNSVDQFFKQIFNINNNTKTKADIEIFTDIYKVLERSIKII